MVHKTHTQSENYFDNRVSPYSALFENGMIEPFEVEKLANRGQGKYNHIGEEYCQGHACAAAAQTPFRDIFFHGLLVLGFIGVIGELSQSNTEFYNG